VLHTILRTFARLALLFVYTPPIGVVNYTVLYVGVGAGHKNCPGPGDCGPDKVPRLFTSMTEPYRTDGRKNDDGLAKNARKSVTTCA
jgi:hypothetical protein